MRPTAANDTVVPEASAVAGFTEERFPGFGGSARVVVVSDDRRRLITHARQRLATLERAWTRFRDVSSGLVASYPAAVVVSPDVLRLVRRAVEAWRRTSGVFDPTIRASWTGAATIAVGDGTAVPLAPPTAPGCSGITVDTVRSLVGLPRGVTIDPDSLGRGLAADVISAELITEGAQGALVDVGGIVRTRGHGPAPDGWLVGEPQCSSRGDKISSVRPGAAVATGTLGNPHHCADLATVTVTASEAWWAEVLVKSIMMTDSVTGLDLGGAAVTVWRSAT